MKIKALPEGLSRGMLYVLFNSESVNGSLVVDLAGIEHYVCKILVVGAVRHSLSLHAEGVAETVGNTVLVGYVFLHHITDIQLHTGLIGIHRHYSSASLGIKLRRFYRK